MLLADVCPSRRAANRLDGNQNPVRSGMSPEKRNVDVTHWLFSLFSNTEKERSDTWRQESTQIGSRVKSEICFQNPLLIFPCLSSHPLKYVTVPYSLSFMIHKLFAVWSTPLQYIDSSLSSVSQQAVGKTKRRIYSKREKLRMQHRRQHTDV